MMSKKKDNMLHNLANLLAIQNDYIRKDDENTVVALYSALANGIDRKHGGEKLLQYAKEAFKIRHPDYDPNDLSAEKSDPSIGGNKDEKTEIQKETKVY